MADTFNITAAYDKTTYNQGDVITVAISGGDVQSIVQSAQVGPLSIPVIAADGATATINIAALQLSFTKSSPQSVVIDTSKAIVDTSPTPRKWTVAANKLSISSTA